MEHKLSAIFTADIGEFKKAMSDAVNSASDVGESIESSIGGAERKTSKGLAGLGLSFAGLATIATGALAGIGVALVGGVNFAQDFQSSLNGLQAQTGATNDEMDSMSDSMKNIYANNFGDSFEEIANTMALAKQTTGAFGSELEGLSQNALMLQDVFGYDVSESLRASDKLMNAFGVTGEQSMAMIAEATQNGLNKHDDLIDTIDEYSQYFSQAGLSGQDMFAILENASEAGVRNLDYVGDSIKEMSIIMMEDSDRASTALSALGLPAEELQAKFAQGGEGAKDAFQQIIGAIGEVQDPLKQSQLAVELFGTKAEDMGVKGILAMGNLEGSVKGTADTLKGMSEIKYDTFGEAFAGIGRILSTELILPIGEKLLPLLSDFANFLSTTLANIDFSAITEKFTNFIGLFTGQYAGVFSIWAENFNLIKPLIQSTLEGIVTFVQEKLAMLKTFWDENGTQIVQAVTNVWSVISAIFQAVLPIVVAIVKFAFDSIKGVISGALDIIMGIVKVFSSLLTGDFSGMWDGIKQVFTGAIQLVWNLMNLSFVGAIRKLALSFVKMLVTSMKGLWDDIALRFLVGKDTAIRLVNALKTGASNAFNTMKTTLANVATSIWNAIKNTFTTMSTGVSNIITGIRTTATNIFNGIKTAITNAVSSAQTTAVNTFNTLKTGATTAFNGLKTSASNIFNSIKTAITSPIETAKKTLLGIIDSIKKAFSNMKITIPKPKLPRVSVGMGSKNFMGAEIPVPTFNVDWYKTGGIFNGSRQGSIVGLAEGGGSEAVLPLSNKSKMKPFSNAVAKQIKDKNTGSESSSNQTITINFNVDKMIANEKQADNLANTIINRLGKMGVTVKHA